MLPLFKALLGGFALGALLCILTLSSAAERGVSTPPPSLVTTTVASTEPPTTEPPVTTTLSPEPTTTTAPPTTRPVVTSARSYAWWEAIAQCESGNTNGWRTGYYGIEADHPIGNLSKAEQLAWAEQIYANYGDRAWGCSPVAWGMVPGG